MTLRRATLALLMLAVLLAVAWARPADEDEETVSTASPQRESSPQSSLFDDIFNIPISVLKAVQRLLSNNSNNNGQGDAAKNNN